MTGSDSKNKSTNVRISNWRDRALRAGLATLDRASPRLAGRVAERLFLSPRGHARPEWESQLVGSARRGAVQYRALSLPTYSWGEGAERVLLLHGWEGRGTQLGAFVPKLLAAGYQVVAVDLPGHGEATPALTSVVDFGRAIGALVRELGPFVGVIGHSMGAAAATLAHTFGAFDTRLVLIGAPRSPRSFLDGFARYFGLSPEAKRELEARITQRFGLSVDAVDVGLLGPQVPLSTLVVHDRQDKIVPFEHGLSLAAALPHARLLETEQLGHRRILRDERVIDAAVAFIEQRADGASQLAPQASAAA